MAGQKYNEKLFATGAKFSVSNVWLLKDQILHEIHSVKAVSSFIYRKPVQYTGLQSHFRSTNYTAFNRRRKNFELNRPA